MRAPSSASTVAARKTEQGGRSRFNSPGPISPNFKPAPGESESRSDARALLQATGGRAVYRSFAFGSLSPCSKPASLGKVQLSESYERRPLGSKCGPVMLPCRCDTPWTQATTAHAFGPHRVANRTQGGSSSGRSSSKYGSQWRKTGARSKRSAKCCEPSQFRACATAHWPATWRTPGGAINVTGHRYGRDGKRADPRRAANCERQHAARLLRPLEWSGVISRGRWRSSPLRGLGRPGSKERTLARSG